LVDASALDLGAENADFSMAFWINLQAENTGYYQTALHQWNNQNQRMGVWVDGNTNQLNFAMSTTANSEFYSYSQGRLTLNQWTHVAYVREGNQISLYLDGQFDSASTIQGETFDINGLLQLGGEFTGALDDVRLYERALSHSDLLSLSRHNADFIEGGTGQDFLYGDEGDDIIYGETSGALDAPTPQAPVATFTGSETIILDHQAPMQLAEGTLSFSFTADNIATNDDQYLFSKDANGLGTGGHLSIHVRDSRLRIRFQDTTQNYFLRSQNLQSNQLYDVAITFGSQGIELWIDGKLIHTNSNYTGGLDGNLEPVVLGASQARSNNLSADDIEKHFHGTLQNVRLIDGQLSGEDIAQLPVAPPTDATVVFETLVADASNNDTIVGGQGHDTLHGNLGNDTLYGDEAAVTGEVENGSRYLLTDPAMSWIEAQAYAESLGGNLVTINNAEEEEWLQDTFGISQGFWIGFTDQAVEGEWQWISGETVTYTNWNPGQPNNSGGDQDYARMNHPTNNLWDDESNTRQLYGIVEIALSEGSDVLIGNSGNDLLFGEGGNDTLNGTSSSAAGAFERDALTGGTGSDRFILGDASRAYYLADGADDYALIRDFSASEDLLQLFGSASNYTQQQQGNNLHLYYGGTELMAIFENVDALNLNTIATFV
ncbi:MAG: LamG-like jellyroll fold domain-containing protein, partial [Cyanobacteria bacterium J06632_3]